MPGTIPWRRGAFDHEGEEIAFEVSGAGEAVVFCHGAGGNRAVWYQQVAHFARRRLVVTWDQRGFGGSTRRTGDLGPRPAVRDLAALLDHLGVPAAHVVGQSMGGWCALGFALQYPDRVRSVVLADTIAGIFTPEVVETLTAMPTPPVPPDPPLLGVHPAVRGLDESDLAQAFLYQQISSLGTEVPSLEAIAMILATRWDLDGVGALTTPTLFVFGSEDDLFPPRAIRQAAAAVPDAELAAIDGCTHSPYFQSAERWNETVGTFVDRVSGAARG